jgi:antirestriction protein
MRVYVGTYSKYNSGSIAGDWLDLEDYTDKEGFYQACAELHDDESDPEFMFQDWEDIPSGMISESWIDEEVFELLAMDEEDRKLLTLYRENVNQDGDLGEARDAFHGTYDSAEDYAESFCEDCGYLKDVPDFLKYAIDWERVARDFSQDVDFVEHNGQVWVFNRH